MSKKSEDLEKKTLFFRRGDWEKISDAYPNMPVSLVVRVVVGKFVDKFDQPAGEVRELEISEVTI